MRKDWMIMKTKNFLFIFLIWMFLMGCSNSEYSRIKNENITLKETVINLESKLNENSKLIKKLQEDIKNIEVTNNENIHSFFNVNTEKILFVSKTLEKNDLTIDEIKIQMGKPIKTETYEGVSGKYTVLKYEEIEFTFHDHIKWYRIIKPNLSTSRGIKIGSSKEEVFDAYSKDYSGFLEQGSMLIYGEKAGISFRVENEKVQEIIVRFEYE